MVNRINRVAEPTIVTCAFCSFTFGPATEDACLAAIRRHLWECPKHPLGAAHILLANCEGVLRRLLHDAVIDDEWVERLANEIAAVLNAAKKSR